MGTEFIRGKPERFGENRFIAGSERLSLDESGGGAGDALVLLVPGVIGGEVVETLEVEQAETREMAGFTELLRGGGDEEDVGSFGREGFDQVVFGAGLLRGPAEVMGFIDDEEVPIGRGGLGEAVGTLAEKIDAGDDELVVLERVGFGIVFLDGFAAFFIEDGEPKVEAAVKLDEPLVDEGFRDEDERATGAAGEQEAMENEAAFNGLAEADFVREKEPSARAVRAFGGNVELVRDEGDAAADEPADWGSADFAGELQGAEAEVKRGTGIDVAGEEAFARGVERHLVRKERFLDGVAVRVVNEEAIFLGDFADLEFFVAVTGADGFARPELDALEGSAGDGVNAGGAGGAEKHGDLVRGHAENHPKTEFRFSLANPTLSGHERKHRLNIRAERKCVDGNTVDEGN